MNYFYWNKKFETGVAKIDSQHKQLVSLINKYSLAFSSQSELPEIQTVLSNLQEYIALHFNDEEQLLDSSDLSDLQKTHHKQQHNLFNKSLQEMIDSNDIADYGFAAKLHQYLTTWLISHILGTDMQLARSIKNEQLPEKNDTIALNISNVEYILLSALNESEHRFRFYTDNAPTIVWMADQNGRRTYFNQTYHDFVGEHDPLDEGSWIDLVYEEDRETYISLLDNINNVEHSHVAEYRLKRHDQQYRYLYERIIPRFEEDGSFIGYIASAMDITELKAAEKLMKTSNRLLEEEVERRTSEIKKLITIDELTQIGNRRYIVERLNDEAARAKRYQRCLCLLFIDADDFKQINDHYGHQVGDKVLINLANCLKEMIRHNDCLGRYGGEEFLVLLPEMPLLEAQKKAQAICDNVAAIQIPGLDAKVTVSIGVAKFDFNESVDSLVERGDKALYHSKRNGKNQVTVG